MSPVKSDTSRRSKIARANPTRERTMQAARADGGSPGGPHGRAPGGGGGTTVDSDERRKRIAERAYYKALDRGFCGGEVERDWLEAEREIDEEILRERA